MQRHELRRGRAAELVGEQLADLLVGSERLRHVTARGQHLHPQPIPAFAERGPLDQLRGGAFGGSQLGAAEPETDLGDQLQRRQLDVLQLTAVPIEPRRLDPRQETAARDRQRSMRRSPSLLPNTVGNRSLRTRDRLAGEPHVDLCFGRKHEPELAASLDHAGSKRAPETREERVEPRRGVGGRMLRPETIDQLVPPHRAVGVERQVAKEQPTLRRRQRALHAVPVDLDDERTTELNPHGRRRLQRFVNQTASVAAEARPDAKAGTAGRGDPV
ncbi:MAG TPA: hypothetical protein VFA19_07325 [Gaiellaceae bacterium]|nr:hypothetical protein [Gaiellaceae bacterium]